MRLARNFFHPLCKARERIYRARKDYEREKRKLWALIDHDAQKPQNRNDLREKIGDHV